MNTLTDIRLHYRASVDIAAAEPGVDAWQDVIRIIRSWISKREGLKRETPGFWGSWFFTGGAWRGPSPSQTSLQTAHFEHEPDGQRAWSIRYEHGDAEHNGRRWRTDVGLEADGHHFHLSAAVSWGIRPGFAGREATAPEPNSPGFMSTLLSSDRLDTTSGCMPLAPSVRPLAVGEGHLLKRWLLDPERISPVVYFSARMDGETLPLDLAHLARSVAGSALVIKAESTVLDKELEQLLPRMYQAAYGRVRIYFGRLNPNEPGDFKRHRFFDRHSIGESGWPEFGSVLVHAVHRWTAGNAWDRIRSVEDVERVQAASRFRQLKKTVEKGSDAEIFLKEFEAENERLEARLREQREALSLASESFSELEQERDALRAALRSKESQTVALQKELSLLQKSAETAGFKEHVPESLSAALEKIGALFPDRIFITPEARKGAAAATINAYPSEMPAVWSCLWHTATTLWELHFPAAGKSGNISVEFKERSGFEMAPTEGSQTKDNKKFVRLRSVNYDGEELLTLAHVKYGSLPRMLRVYYAPHTGTRRLVLGHSGNHLDSAATSRLK